MTEIAQGELDSQEMPIPQDLVSALVAKAARAPSVHNTQPWRFEAGRQGLELRADHGRELLRIDPAGREILVSCGAALFGLRLASANSDTGRQSGCCQTQPIPACSPGCSLALRRR
jgi:nitroreductase